MTKETQSVPSLRERMHLKWFNREVPRDLQIEMLVAIVIEQRRAERERCKQRLEKETSHHGLIGHGDEYHRGYAKGMVYALSLIAALEDAP
jgi:hypothetical protein